MGITLSSKGDFSKTLKYFQDLKSTDYEKVLGKYGERGVEALRAATPRDTGKTAESWSYKIERGHDGVTISWHNSNTNDGVNIAVLLQYGHGTGWGGYIQGVDYINPAMRPIFDQIIKDAWEEVRR